MTKETSSNQTPVIFRGTTSSDNLTATLLVWTLCLKLNSWQNMKMQEEKFKVCLTYWVPPTSYVAALKLKTNSFREKKLIDFSFVWCLYYMGWCHVLYNWAVQISPDKLISSQIIWHSNACSATPPQGWHAIDFNSTNWFPLTPENRKA